MKTVTKKKKRQQMLEEIVFETVVWHSTEKTPSRLLLISIRVRINLRRVYPSDSHDAR